jgi:hypothetical protein
MIKIIKCWLFGHAFGDWCRLEINLYNTIQTRRCERCTKIEQRIWRP